MMFSATFNNILVISWLSVLIVEETGVPRENHRPDITEILLKVALNAINLNQPGWLNELGSDIMK
jgi:hypothetical protein